MDTNIISYVLLIFIVSVFVLDFLMKRKNNQLENKIKKFIKKDIKKENWFIKNFLRIYIFTFFSIFPILYWFLPESIGIRDKNFQDFFSYYMSKKILRIITAQFIISSPLFLFYFLSYNKISINWFLERKKNIAMFIFVVVLIKILIHFMLFSEFEPSSRSRF